MNTKWKKMYADVELPTRAYPLDSGVDIKAYIKENIAIQPGQRKLIDTGLIAIIPSLDDFLSVEGDPIDTMVNFVASRGTSQNPVIHEITRVLADFLRDKITIEGQVRPRSGNAHKLGMTCHWGTIDNPYTGELKVNLFNLGEEVVVIQPGSKICQFVTSFVLIGKIEEWTEQNVKLTDRASAGFGSTG
jgi:dUTP pyrophosphatase